MYLIGDGPGKPLTFTGYQIVAKAFFAINWIFRATTIKVWELHNIEKCFQAGYHHVISGSTDPKVLEKIKKLVSDTLDTSSKERVLFLEPVEVVTFLDNLQSEAPIEEKRIKGCRAKVNYENILDQEMKSKKEAIAKMVVDSIRKLENK